MAKFCYTIKTLISILVLLLILQVAFAQKPNIEWVDIPAGQYKMGSAKSENGRESDEVEHVVKLKAFKLSKYEITVGEFKAFIDATGYVTTAEKTGQGAKGGAIYDGNSIDYVEGVNWRHDERGNVRPETDYNYPVINVSWTDAKAFADWMGCFLPTEAQWEYPCRGATVTTFNTGDCITSEEANFNAILELGNCPKGTYKGKLAPVGSYAPNAYGLFDMHGNVFEWCRDWFWHYDKNPQVDPKGPEKGNKRVGRGGSWFSNARDCRSANRNSRQPDYRNVMLGFRISNY